MKEYPLPTHPVGLEGLIHNAVDRLHIFENTTTFIFHHAYERDYTYLITLKYWVLDTNIGRYMKEDITVDPLPEEDWEIIRCRGHKINKE